MSTYSSPYNAISFRPIRLGDSSFINEVRNASRYWLHNDQAFTLEQTRAWMVTSPPWRIVMLGGERIGYFRISNVTEESLYLGMDLHPYYRGRGLALKAYRMFIKELLDNGFKTIHLEVLSHNVVGINLYLKLGFVEVSRTKVREYESIKMSLCLG